MREGEDKSQYDKEEERREEERRREREEEKKRETKRGQNEREWWVLQQMRVIGPPGGWAGLKSVLFGWTAERWMECLIHDEVKRSQRESTRVESREIAADFSCR